MSKITLDQKRLETLRRQLYGKNQTTQKSKQQVTKINSLVNPYQITLKPVQAEIYMGYLKKDMLKIFLLSSIALSTQLLLYFAFKQNLDSLINLF